MRVFPAISVTLLFCGLLALGACDNTISPLADNAENIFSIQGFLDSDADTQFVRVGGLRTTVLADPPSMEGIVVRTRRSPSGEIVVWEKIPEPDSAAAAGHLFAGLFRPELGVKYTLQVVRDDAVVAFAETTLPPDPAIFPQPATGDTANYTQPVIIGGLNGKPLSLDMKYAVSGPEPDSDETFLYEYDQAGEVTTMGWKFYVFLKRDQIKVEKALCPDGGCEPPLELLRLGLVITVESEEYARPDNPSNLHNAHGFFGSISKHEVSWVLDDPSVGVIGYSNRQSPQ